MKINNQPIVKTVMKVSEDLEKAWKDYKDIESIKEEAWSEYKRVMASLASLFVALNK